MSPTKKAGIDQSDAVKSIIKKYLGKKTKGRQIIAAFEQDPKNNNNLLVNYIKEQLPKDKYESLVEEISQALGGQTSKAQINNFITGGQIDQLINIGRVDNLTIEKKISPFKDVKQLLVFLSVFLFVAAAIYTAYWYSVQPRKMNGDFNIAIAQFGEVTDAGIKPTALSTKIGNSLLNYLDSEFKASSFDLVVDVSNHNMPLITENAEAEKLANQIKATIVIYGNVYVRNGGAELSPRFYVSQDFDASELTGENELAKPIDVDSIYDQKTIEMDLKERSTILINFIYSLIFLSDHSYDSAIVFSQKAINAAETSADDFAGKENLYLIAAHIETARKNYDIANRLLDKALGLNSNYARAHIARGNIYYGQAIQSKPYDNILLEKALGEYQKAYETQDQPIGANIPIKAHMAIGNIYFLKARNANNNPALYLTAIENYRFVVDQYENSKNPSLQELAALNYFNIGIAFERAGNLPQAIESYENALKTTSDSKFRENVENQLNVTKKLLNSP